MGIAGVFRVLPFLTTGFGVALATTPPASASMHAAWHRGRFGEDEFCKGSVEDEDDDVGDEEGIPEVEGIGAELERR